MRNGTSQSPFRTRSSTADCAPAVPVTGTPSQHRFARCDSVASSRDDSTPRSDARFVSPLALTHVGYTVSPRGFRGLTASAFSLPWRSAAERNILTISSNIAQDVFSYDRRQCYLSYPCVSGDKRSRRSLRQTRTTRTRTGSLR